MSDLKIGTRVRCETCGSVAVVITANAPKLECCGQPLTEL
jgi:desulfoferrodoxin-like iron-binding protein